MAEQSQAKESWRTFRRNLAEDPSQLHDRQRLATENGWMPLFNLTKWLKRKTGKEDDAAAVQWPLLAGAFTPQVAEAYRNGICQLWCVTAPERPEHTSGGITTKWTTILSYAGLAVESASDPRWAAKLSAEEARIAALHGCYAEQGYPKWIEPLASQHPDVVVPIVRNALATEWMGQESGGTYFLYRYGSAGIANQLIRREVLTIIAQNEPIRLNALDYGLRILSHLELKPDEQSELRRIALARFHLHARQKPDWALRYIALLFLVDPATAASKLMSWLRKTPARRRKGLSEKAVATLFGINDPLVSISLRSVPVHVLEELLQFVYAAVNPKQDIVHEGSYTPDTRDGAESGRNAVLKALLDVPGPESYAAMLRLSRSRAVGDSRIRFRELARGMAERDTEAPGWEVTEVLKFEREAVRPIKSADDLHRVVLNVLDEISWAFSHDDASSRAVLETAANEDAVQEWLAEQLLLRAKGRYHVHRESEVAEGNLPDILVSAATASFEVAIEAKHGDKGWTVATLEHAMAEQLAQDYLRPSNRRHGIFVLTRHRKKTWRDTASGTVLKFAHLVEHLSAKAAMLKSNRVGPITVAARGIDAAPRPRSRKLSGSAVARNDGARVGV